MKRSLAGPALGCILSVFLLGACNKSVESKEAVRDGVLKYIGKRGDLAAMDVSVSSVQFHGNDADATVHFQAKGNSSPAAGMSMVYALERKGNEWVVKGRTGGGPAHAGGSVAPTEPQGQQLPPGHPSIAPGQTMPGNSMPELPQMPPGHPGVNAPPSR